jgi:hypothetical protein
MKKKKKKKLAIAALSLAVSASIAGALLAESVFSFETINFPTDTFTQLLGINDNGGIAGYHGSGAAGHPNQGFTLVPPRSFNGQNFPGSVQTQVIGINNGAGTDGFYIDTAGVNHGFTTIAGTFATVDFPNKTSVLTQLLGINNEDEVAGYWQNGAGVQFPFTEKAARSHPSIHLCRQIRALRLRG